MTAKTPPTDQGREEGRPTPPKERPPFFRPMQAMIGLAVLWLAWVILSAARPPDTGAEGDPDLDRLARGVTGFDLAFPPRPVPDGLTGRLAEDGVTLAVFLPDRCAADCRGAIAALGEAAEAPVLLVAPTTLADPYTFVAGADAPAGPDAEMLIDEDSLFAAYRGTDPRPLVVAFREGQEVGRGRGVDWASDRAGALLDALERL